MKISNELLDEYIDFAEQLAEVAAEAILPFFRQEIRVENKGGKFYDPVTTADKAAENAMRHLIRSHYPNHGILGEEVEPFPGDGQLTWVLDPIDGTRAFITGLPLWGTLIALNDGECPILGLMNQPFMGERFIGSQHGSWLNASPLKTRHCPDLSGARLMCTTPDMFAQPKQRKAFELLARQCQLLRFGGDCYAYCMLASGFVDIIVEASLQPYDVQALIPIVEGAGGRITNWDGNSAQHGGAIVACGDPKLHDAVVTMLKNLNSGGGKN